jgi:hypothetical protein
MQATLLALTLINLGLAMSALGLDRTLAGPAVEPLVRAEMIELVDQAGTVRSRLSVAPDGEVIFRLMDQAGTIRVKLGAGSDGSGLLLANDMTAPGIHMLATAKATSVTLKNQSGNEKVISP